MMNCNYCGREIETTPCFDCFPKYKCKTCGTIVGYIGVGHKKPDGEWCDNPVRGFGDTRSDDYWLLITEDNYRQEGLKKFGDSHEVRAKVRFFGDDIGFQFSQTCQGSSSRMARITNIHRATEEDKAEMGEALHDDYERHKCGSKGTRRRLYSLDSEDFMLLAGHSNFRFEGENPRLVKVACVRYQKTPLEQCRWESYKTIYEDEGDA